MNLILLLAIILAVVIYSKRNKITDQVGSRVNLRIKPNKRTYSPQVELSEHIYYDVIPQFGIVTDIIINHYDEVQFLMNDPQTVVKGNDLRTIYIKQVPKDFANYAIFEKFFETVQLSNNPMPIADALTAIRFGLVKQ